MPAIHAVKDIPKSEMVSFDANFILNVISSRLAMGPQRAHARCASLSKDLETSGTICSVSDFALNEVIHQITKFHIRQSFTSFKGKVLSGKRPSKKRPNKNWNLAKRGSWIDYYKNFPNSIQKSFIDIGLLFDYIENFPVVYLDYKSCDAGQLSSGAVDLMKRYDLMATDAYLVAHTQLSEINYLVSSDRDMLRISGLNVLVPV